MGLINTSNSDFHKSVPATIFYLPSKSSSYWLGNARLAYSRRAVETQDFSLGRPFQLTDGNELLQSNENTRISYTPYHLKHQS